MNSTLSHSTLLVFSTDDLSGFDVVGKLLRLKYDFKPISYISHAHKAIDFEMNHVRCEVTHHIPELHHVTIIRVTMISCRNNSVVCLQLLLQKCCKIFAVGAATCVTTSEMSMSTFTWLS